MVQRAAALFAVAVYSEVMLSEGSGREEALFYFNKMEQLYGVESYLTPDEAAYIETPIRKSRSAFSSDGAMNVQVSCFGRQALWMICLIRPRLSMSLFWLLFFGNIKA